MKLYVCEKIAITIYVEMYLNKETESKMVAIETVTTCTVNVHKGQLCKTTRKKCKTGISQTVLTKNNMQSREHCQTLLANSVSKPTLFQTKSAGLVVVNYTCQYNMLFRHNPNNVCNTLFACPNYVTMFL